MTKRIKRRSTAIPLSAKSLLLTFSALVLATLLEDRAQTQENGIAPLSAVVVNSALSEIRSYLAKNPTASAPVILPIHSTRLLAALESAGIVVIVRGHQSFSPRAQKDLGLCSYSEPAGCRAVPVGRKRLLPSPVVEAYREPRSLNSDEDTVVFFRFAVDWDTKMLGPALGEHYWVSYNTVGPMCPSPISANTAYLGEYSHFTHDPDVDGPVDASTSFERRGEAKASPGTLSCRFQIMGS